MSTVPPLPEGLKVAAFDIAVVPITCNEAIDSCCFGDFSATLQRIRVDTSVPKWKVLDTFLHEIHHAIYWAYGIEDEDKEERIVGTFATAWTQVYRDNPELVRWIADVTRRGPRINADLGEALQ